MNKAIFIDRDGVINENLYEVDGKIMSPATLEQLKIIPKVKEGLEELRKLGFKIIVVTNQPGIPFGYLSKEKLEEINNFLIKTLKIDKIYSCPHHPKFTGECACRKPKIGLIEEAKKEFNLSLKDSYMVGDSLSDIETGKNACSKKTFLIGQDRIDVRNIMHQKNVFPDFINPNLLSVAEKIKDLEHSKK